MGDEALLLAEQAPTHVSKCRVSGVQAAVAAGARTVVLDDGLQNPTLAKDLQLLVLDAESGVGNGRVLPAGPLREPMAEALQRADAVVLMHPELRQSSEAAQRSSR